MIEELFKDPYVQKTLILSLMAVITAVHFGHIKSLRSSAGVKGLQIGNAQIIGRRERQDDSFATAEAEYGTIAVVADGIGGLLNGKLASSMAVKVVIDEFMRGDITPNIEYFFKKAAVRANQEIADAFGEKHGGTTLMIAVIIDQVLHYAYSGDSMIAVYRDKRFVPLNTKQNVSMWLEKQYQSGNISREEARKYSGNKKLVEYVGHDGYTGIEIGSRPVFLRRQDKVVLYTDGVEALGDMAMEEILAGEEHADGLAEQVAEALVRKQKPNQDNATIIILSVM